jgi:hypothetical protein
MIQLCIHTGRASDNFTIDDVPIIIENLEEFIIPYIARQDEFPIPRIDIQLCQWYPFKDDTYISFNLLINLEDITDFTIRINEGAYCSTNNDIIDIDGFVDINPDIPSIQQAINDIKSHSIPLRNRVHSIKFDEFPYVKRYEDEDEYV